MPTDHAPIGVMGDHTHKVDEWMFSYRYGHMEMDGNRDGTSSVSVAEIHQDFMIAPLKMTMEMHMFGSMLYRKISPIFCRSLCRLFKSSYECIFLGIELYSIIS